jgi:hypothetical protein
MGDKGADAMYKLSSDVKSIIIILIRNRMIDMDTEGGEEKSIIIIMNILIELNTLYISII